MNRLRVNKNRSGIRTYTDYYDMDGTENSYITTTLDLNTVSDCTFVYDGTIGDNTVERTIFGVNNQSTRLFIRLLTNNDLSVQYYNGTGLSSNDKAWTGRDTNRHRFVFTYSTVNGADIFVDGVSLGIAADLDFTGWVASRLLWIGRRAAVTTVSLEGACYYVQVYNRALSSTEVKHLETSLHGISSGKILDLRNQKGTTTWTSEVGGETATAQSGVTYT